MRFALTTAALALLPLTALADGPGALESEPVVQSISPEIVEPNVLRFTAGVGLQSRPGYFGAEENILSPTGTFRFEYLRYGSRQLGQADPYAEANGLSFGGSLRIVSARTAEEFPELAGLEDLDLSVELGAGITYSQPAYEVFADVRYGAIGHEAWVGEIGADVFVRPTDQLTLSVGPRVFLGSDDYAETYFGVDEDHSSVLEAYDARGGILSAGVEVGAQYQVNDTWGVEGSVRWDRYLGDAADSPIVTGGSDDNVTATIMATRRFSFEF